MSNNTSSTLSQVALSHIRTAPPASKFRATIARKQVASMLGRLLHPRIIKRRYPALTAPKAEADLIARHQAIENDLCLALWHIRQDVSPKHIHAATVKAVRAASMLKQACTESINGGRS